MEPLKSMASIAGCRQSVADMGVRFSRDIQADLPSVAIALGFRVAKDNRM